ncbi:uncharacterized protein LOC142226461 isoform X2 [Haematobia irritans]|uniref:uncharacterized protein LOC142226461 isoform X1 n=1 Tax=Haematobia irritans TaxID=7368 RepID=UPI003F4F85FD
MDSKVFAILLIFLCTIIHKVSTDCYINLPIDPSLRPTFRKSIGSRFTTIQNDEERIVMEDEDELLAYCGTRFTRPQSLAGKTSYKLTCPFDFMGYRTDSIDMKCDLLKWNLYESATRFRWCPPTMVSYILARQFSSVTEYLAGICFNFEEMQPLTIYFSIAPKFSNYTYPSKMKSYSPDKEIIDIPRSFISRNITTSMYDNSDFREWIQFANYENHSIIQNPDLYRDSYYTFGGLLTFAWWPTLRLGNWRLYEQALAKHIEETATAYDVLAGISGTVSVPIYTDNCAKNRTLVELVDKKNRKIPLYVWHYLKSTKVNSTFNNFVVIGINSPFYDFYDPKDIVFCTDICDKIDWLHRDHWTFRYNSMGIIFCCSVDEVRNSNRLNGFPSLSKPVTPLPPPMSLVRTKPKMDDFDEPVETENQPEEGYNYVDE